MLHIPALRAGRPYRSLETVGLSDVRTGEPVAEVSQANRGIIARDLLDAAEYRRALRQLPVSQLIETCSRAAKLFMEGDLPVDPDDGSSQGPDDYVKCQSATTGLPESLCRANMEKTRFVMAEMERVLAGLTRGVDLSVLDDGWVKQDGRTVCYLGEADNMGAILPSNSPGVHALWIPSVALKVPLVLKPGRREPWTPMRVAQALIAAGCPPQAISYYPTDYSGATEVLLRTDRSMLFGDEGTIRPWKQDHRVQLHGPGWSKVILGEDRADDWERYLDMMVTSIAANGGRSCVNASGVRVPRHGRAVAEALAERLSRIEARALDDPAAELAAFSDPSIAHRISAFIDQQLQVPGAEDLTARHRKKRVVELNGCTFVLPTLVWCDSAEHPLASTELLFPFVSVVETPGAALWEQLGMTLVLSAVTDDPELRGRLMISRDVDRLNLGPLPTNTISWDQPHEGNLFEHLYRQRAFQAEPDAASAA